MQVFKAIEEIERILYDTVLEIHFYIKKFEKPNDLQFETIVKFENIGEDYDRKLIQQYLNQLSDSLPIENTYDLDKVIGTTSDGGFIARWLDGEVTLNKKLPVVTIDNYYIDGIPDTDNTLDKIVEFISNNRNLFKYYKLEERDDIESFVLNDMKILFSCLFAGRVDLCFLSFEYGIHEFSDFIRSFALLQSNIYK